jgi:hypothetical protein
MTRSDILHLLAQHRDKLDELKVKRLALFGSVARGEDESDSDLDMLVEFTQPISLSGEFSWTRGGLGYAGRDSSALAPLHRKGFGRCRVIIDFISKISGIMPRTSCNIINGCHFRDLSRMSRLKPRQSNILKISVKQPGN